MSASFRVIIARAISYGFRWWGRGPSQPARRLFFLHELGAPIGRPVVPVDLILRSEGFVSTGKLSHSDDYSQNRKSDIVARLKVAGCRLSVAIII